MLARGQRTSLLCVWSVYLLGVAGLLPAQESAPDKGVPNGAAALSGEAAGAKQAFDKKFQEWKAAMREIEALRIRYQTAEPEDREPLAKQLQQRFEGAQLLVSGVVDAAVKAYQAAPKGDQQITNFLIEVAGFYLGSDRYEEVLPIVDALRKGEESYPWLPVWGGIASVAVGDFERAEQYFQDADGILSQRPQSQGLEELWGLARNFAEQLPALREKWEQEQQIRAREAQTDDLPRVLMKTNRGDILIELFENEAPNTVKNFVTLVEKGFYNGRVFHRVLPNFMAQGGGFLVGDSGDGGPGHAIPCECYQRDARMHFRGTLSMAHAGRDTGGSQFFLTFRPTPHLDGAHTVFGRVIDGLDVLAKIQRRDPNKKEQPPADQILQADVVRKRPDTSYGQFRKVGE